MRMIFRPLGVIVLGLFLASAGEAMVDLTATELVKVSGTVQVKKGQAATFKKVPANLQLAGALKRLDAGDKVKTEAQSGAEMVLKETCVLGVKENTLFEVPQAVGQTALTQLKAQKGSFLFKVVSGSDLKVQTADVVAGVKGTLFEVEIVDSFLPVLLTPGLEIGLENAGGTMVNVYEGEVELTHSESRQARRLKAGEGIAALAPGLMRLDKALEQGFGQIRRFNPLQRVKERFGSIGEALQRLPATRLGLGGLNFDALSMPRGIGGRGERLTALFDGFSGPLAEKFGRLKAIGGRLEQVQERLRGLQQLKKGLAGEPFVPVFDERTYPRPAGPILVPDQGINEAHLGHGLFLAMAPADGCPALKVGPDQEGLTLQEGEGSFRIRHFANGLDSLVTVRTEGNHLVTIIDVLEGTLLARVPGDPKGVAITKGSRLTGGIDLQTGQVALLPSAPTIAPLPRLVSYRLLAETEVEAQKARHDQKTRDGQAGAVKTLLQGLGQNGAALNLQGVSPQAAPSQPAAPAKATPTTVQKKIDKAKNGLNKLRGLFGR